MRNIQIKQTVICAPFSLSVNIEQFLVKRVPEEEKNEIRFEAMPSQIERME